MNLYSKKAVTMIINTKINYNNYKEKVIENFVWFKCQCPNCETYGNLIRYGKYNRFLCVMENKEFIKIKMHIQRVYCKFCGCTHAILPIEAIPYCYYSQICVLEILKRYFVKENTTNEITKEFNISHILVYLLVLKFKNFSKYMVDFLRVYFGIDLTCETGHKLLMKSILSNTNVYSLIKTFFDHSKKIFLMMRSQNILSKKISIGVYD